MTWFFSIFFLLLTGCSDSDAPPSSKGEQIARLHNEYSYRINPPQYAPSPPYPWEEDQVANLPKITKEFFRCNGSLLNPEKMVEKGGSLEALTDCGGSEKHSLPLQDNQEFIYPILTTLLTTCKCKREKGLSLQRAIAAPNTIPMSIPPKTIAIPST